MKNKNLLLLPLLALSFLTSCKTTTPSSTSTQPTDSKETTSTKPAESYVKGEKNTYVFEAEYSPSIEDSEGNGFSGTATGTSMIQEDNGGKLGASNGYFVGYLYKTGLELDYTINSDKAVNNATFVFRIATQFYNVRIGIDTYQIKINGELLIYDDIELKVGANNNDITPFKDYTLTTSLNLKEGENNIALITSNSNALGGTMQAEAPIIDCFKITTDAWLTWTPKIYF